MRLAAIILFAALLFALPTISHAQYNDTDQQNPKEYHDEDSQPVALMADILYPLGFAAEWLIVRPVHYITTNSPVAAMFRPAGGNDLSPPPPVPIIPDNTMESAAAAPAIPQDWSPTRKPITTNATTVAPAAPAGAAPATTQPALR